MTIQSVAVLGAGAIGSYFIAGLSEKLGDNLCVIAEGERKARLKRDGLVINEQVWKPIVKTPEEAKGVDLLLIATKYGALRETLPAIETIVTEHTIVVSTLNGVDSEEIIAEKIGKAHIVYSMMRIAAERKGNSIVYNPAVTQGIFFGEADRTRSERIEAMIALFEGSGVNYMVCDDIIRDIWFKYASNVSANLPQAVVGCGYGGYDASEHLQYIVSKLREEVVAVAAAKGIDIRNEADAKGAKSIISPKARFSTLQDLDAGRHTEIDMFSGAMIRMGKEYGIPTPFNEYTYHIIKALEEKNDGLLD